MPAVSITGAEFTVTLGATPYTDQVTSGTITTTPTVVRTKTLSSVAFNQTDLNSTISIEFLYDDNTGMYDALQTAIAAGTSLGLTIVGDTDPYLIAPVRRPNGHGDPLGRGLQRVAEQVAKGPGQLGRIGYRQGSLGVHVN